MKNLTGDAMVTFDLRMGIVSFALLEICNHFKAMKPGEVIRIICVEPGIEQDLRCILPEAQYASRRLAAPQVQRGTRVIHLRKPPTS